MYSLDLSTHVPHSLLGFGCPYAYLYARGNGFIWPGCFYRHIHDFGVCTDWSCDSNSRKDHLFGIGGILSGGLDCRHSTPACRSTDRLRSTPQYAHQSWRKQDDVTDAIKLCRWFRLGELKEVYHAEEDHRVDFKIAVQQYLRVRNDLTSMKTQLKSKDHQAGMVEVTGTGVFTKTHRASYL